MTQSGFTRRTFIRHLGELGAAAAVLPRASRTSSAAESRDRYGGLESIWFDASGYFRVEKRERWWFVTPDGRAFLSFGLNHPNPDYISQDYNVEFWKKQFGVADTDDPAFLAGFVEKTMRDMELFGMNTLGCHALKEKFGKITVPYIQGLFFVRTAYWLVQSPRSFPDVFSDAFVQLCQRRAESIVAPKREDPYLMGYTFTNVPILTDLDADAHGQVPWGRSQPNMPTWPRALRNLGPAAPGKRVFVQLMRDRYPTIQAFNIVYQTEMTSFDELLNTQDWSSTEKADEIADANDNRAFLLKILDRYYSVACAAVRKFDTNHLIFGDPLNANAGVPDDIMSLISRHTDLISYQYYGGFDEQIPLIDRWSQLTGKPLFHADSCFSVPYAEMPYPVGALCPDQETRARRFLDMATRAFARPDFIGWNWCGWMDSWKAWKTDRQHPGLQDPFGRYHEPMPQTMARFGSQMYEYALGKRAPVRYKAH